MPLSSPRLLRLRRPWPPAALAFTTAVATAWLLALPARADDAAEVRALLAQGQGLQALQQAERAVAAQPKDVQLRFLLGVVLMDLQRDDAALAHFGAMTQDYPELPDPWNNIALLQARAGRLDLARQALEQALRNDPSHRAARANLGQVHLMLAAQAWELANANGPLDLSLQRRLQAVRALLAGVPAPAR